MFICLYVSNYNNKKKDFYLRWTFFFFLQIKFTFAIYMNRWILPIGGVAWGRVCACSLHSRIVSTDLTGPGATLGAGEAPHTGRAGGKEAGLHNFFFVQSCIFQILNCP